MKYLWLLLPIASIWMGFGLHELLDLHLTDEYEYINGSYVLVQNGQWYGFPYVITSIFSIAATTIITIIKVTK